jgi:hypothetical protein
MDWDGISYNHDISRRFLVASAVGVSAAAVAGKHFATATEAPGVNNKELAPTFARLLGRADGKSAYWVMRGVRYLWTGSREPVPLYNVDMLTVVKFTPTENGEYLVGTLENSYSTDFNGKIIKSFINPLTNKEESFWTGSPYPPTYYTLKPDGQRVHKASGGDAALTLEKMQGTVRFQRGFPGEIVVEDRWNDAFKTEDGTPHYAEVAVHYRTESPKLILNGASYENVTKTHVISRHWPHEGGETVHAPQLLGIYHGRKYHSAEEAYAVPGVKDVEIVGPGTLKQIAEF